MRKPENRVRLYDDKRVFIETLLTTPAYSHITNLNAAVDMVLTHYILLTTTTNTSTPTTVGTPTKQMNTTSLLKRVPKP